MPLTPQRIISNAGVLEHTCAPCEDIGALPRPGQRPTVGSHFVDISAPGYRAWRDKVSGLDCANTWIYSNISGKSPAGENVRLDPASPAQPQRPAARAVVHPSADQPVGPSRMAGHNV
jgi:hypothetical protein